MGYNGRKIRFNDDMGKMHIDDKSVKGIFSIGFQLPAIKLARKNAPTQS